LSIYCNYQAKTTKMTSTRTKPTLSRMEQARVYYLQMRAKHVVDSIKEQDHIGKINNIIEEQQGNFSDIEILLIKYIQKTHKFRICMYSHAHNRNKEKTYEFYNKIKIVSQYALDLLVFENIENINEGLMLEMCNKLKERLELDERCLNDITEYYWK